jgi:hypothetical protein
MTISGTVGMHYIEEVFGRILNLIDIYVGMSLG